MLRSLLHCYTLIAEKCDAFACSFGGGFLLGWYAHDGHEYSEAGKNFQSTKAIILHLYLSIRQSKMEIYKYTLLCGMYNKIKP